MEEIKELEIGEFVRTKNGIIDKIENYSLGCCVWHCVKGMCIDRCNTIGTHLTDIVKHSKNIKDLVQAEDVIVYTIKGLEHSTYIDIVKEHTDARTLKSKLRVRIYSLEQLNIKQVLTKEQFTRESYKVEEE